MTVRHLLEVDDLTPDELLAVLDRCENEHPVRVLEDRGAALIFEKPSNRTRNSTEMAVVQLGGHPIYLKPDEVDIDGRESAEDVARTLACYHAVIAARVHDHGDEYGHVVLPGLGAGNHELGHLHLWVRPPVAVPVGGDHGLEGHTGAQALSGGGELQQRCGHLGQPVLPVGRHHVAGRRSKPSGSCRRSRRQALGEPVGRFSRITRDPS